MNELLQNLLKLQGLDFDETSKNDDALRADLRGKIPPPILSHYDRLVARGKKGVAIVRNQVCTGCHMKVTLAVIATLRHGTDIQLCDNCGRYLCLEEGGPAIEAPAGKPAPKPRKRRAAAVAA